MWHSYYCLFLAAFLHGAYSIPINSTVNPELTITIGDKAITSVPTIGTSGVSNKNFDGDGGVETSDVLTTNNENSAGSSNGDESTTTLPTMTIAEDITTIGINDDGGRTVTSSGITTTAVPMTTASETTATNNMVNATIEQQNKTMVKEEKYDGPSSILFPVCSGFIGISNKNIIKDNQITATSTYNTEKLLKIINATLESLSEESTGNTSTNKTSEKTTNYTINGNQTAAHHGRLGNQHGSWCASSSGLDGDHHMIIDLGGVRILEGVVTQGRADSDNWVTSFMVETSSDKQNWYPIKKAGNTMVFKGNKDRNSVVVGSFPERIAARYLKFSPKTFHGKFICMRVDAIGCHPDTVNIARDQPSNQSTIKDNSTSWKAVDGDFIHEFDNDTCSHTQRQDFPWYRIDLGRVYVVKELFISDHGQRVAGDMYDFEVRVGNDLNNEGNDNGLCSSMETVNSGQIKTVVCKNGTVGRYINIRIPREDSVLSLCEVAVLGVADTVVKLGLEDIANSLKTGVVVDKLGKGQEVIGGLIGQLQSQGMGLLGGMGMGMLGNLQGMGMGMLGNLQGQGMGMLGNLQGMGMGMLGNLQGQGMGMLGNLQGQGMGMLNNLKGQGLGMVNDLKNQGLGMANKLKEQGMGMVNDLKNQGMGMVNDLKGQGMGMVNDLKGQGMGMVNDLKGQGMGMVNDLQGQGMGMVGDMQGEMNKQQDKFKKKLKEFLKLGKEYLKEGQKKFQEFKDTGYIEDGKAYMDKGLKITMDGIAFLQAKISESLSNIAGDMTQQITTLSEYDTSDVKGLLDDVNSEDVRNFVLDVRPKISKLYDDIEEAANKYIKLGIKRGVEAKDEIEKEATSAADQATSMGKNVAGKATSMGKNMANKATTMGKKMADKAKNVGMGAMNKIKEKGMGAVNKLKKAGMDAVNKGKDAAMGAVNKAQSLGMGALGKAKNAGMGAFNQAKGLGQGALGQGMGALGGLKQGVLGGLQGQLSNIKGQLGNLKGQFGQLQAMYNQLSGTGKELLKKAQDKPQQVAEMQQIGMLQNLKKLKEMQKLKEQLEDEQNEQWKTFESLSNEMTGKEEILKKNLDDLKSEDLNTDTLKTNLDEKIP